MHMLKGDFDRANADIEKELGLNPSSSLLRQIRAEAARRAPRPSNKPETRLDTPISKQLDALEEEMKKVVAPASSQSAEGQETPIAKQLKLLQLEKTIER